MLLVQLVSFFSFHTPKKEKKEWNLPRLIEALTYEIFRSRSLILLLLSGFLRWSVRNITFRDQIFEIEILRAQTRKFVFRNYKFRVCADSNFWVSKLEILREIFLNSKFRVSNSKLRVCKGKILRLQIRNFEFRNLKARLSKLKVPSLQTQNLVFVNSKFGKTNHETQCPLRATVVFL